LEVFSGVNKLKIQKNIKMKKTGTFIIAIVLMVIQTGCESKADKINNSKKAMFERFEKETFEKYKDNYLNTGTLPYNKCFGWNKSCNYDCSEIVIKSPTSTDVLVTLKRNNRVVRHAYIEKNSKYTFTVPNGNYQPFFYYGNGWNPKKKMSSNSCSKLTGGFVKDESFGKDDVQRLYNNVLTYELILQRNGNLQTKSSNSSEAF